MIREAVDRWIQAAKFAEQRFSHKEAIQHLEQGLILIDKLDDSNQHQKAFEVLGLLTKLALSEYGFGLPGFKKMNERFIKVAEITGKSKDTFLPRLSLIAYKIGAGNLQIEEELEELMQLAKMHNDPFFLAASYQLIALKMQNLGDFQGAKLNLETALRYYNPAIHDLRKTYNGGNLKVVLLAYDSIIHHLLGYPDHALAIEKEKEQLAGQLNTMIDSSVHALFAAYFYLYRREYDKTIKTIKTWLKSMEGREYSFAFYETMSSVCLHAANAYQGIEQAAPKTYESARKLFKFMKLFHSPSMAFSAEAYLHLGKPAKSLEILNEALSDQSKTLEGVYLPELYRIKGECLLLQESHHIEAEGCFLKALQIARQQSAKWHELLAAKSLAGLWKQQGKVPEAFELLNNIYSWFKEGFDLIDMKEAKKMLDDFR